VAERRLTERPQAPSGLRPELPPQLDQLVLRCLELAPEARFASAAQVLGALGEPGARA
jgi:hypothetical protein